MILPDGRRVRGRGLRQAAPLEDAQPDLGLCLSLRPPPRQPWESIWVCWPDFWLPLRIDDAIEAVHHVYAAARTRRVEIGCRGGTGRTGAVIALLARLAGVPGPDAVAWTRAHYRTRAVETPWQRRFVATVDLTRGPSE